MKLKMTANSLSLRMTQTIERKNYENPQQIIMSGPAVAPAKYIDLFSPHFCFSVDSSTRAFNEPKFIVFYSSLISIFSLFCFNCKEPKPSVTMKTKGTMVTVRQSCSKCIFGYEWHSQPFVLNKYPAGNILALTLTVVVLLKNAVPPT